MSLSTIASTSSIAATSDPARTVAVNASLFRAARGANPDGHGWWSFDFYADGHCIERGWRYGGDYRRAIEAARFHALRIGAAAIELIP